MLKRLRGLIGHSRNAGSDSVWPPMADPAAMPAAAALERMLESADGEALQRAARTLVEAGRLEDAHRCLERAAAIAPASAAIVTDLGTVLRARGDALGAAARYAEALARDPAFSPALVNLGTLRLALGQPAEAMELLEKAVAADPGSALVLRLAGAAAQAAGDLSRAERRLQASLAITPDADTARSLAAVLDALGRGAEADRALERVAAQRPEDPTLPELLGARALARQEPEAAVRWFERAIDAAPAPSAALHSNLGLACLRAGRLDDAIDALETAIHFDSAFAPAHLNLGLAFAEARQWPESEAAFARALELRPEDVHAFIGLGKTLHKQYRLEEALLALEQAVSLAPASHESWVRLGLVLRDLGRYKDAAAAFERALSGDGAASALAKVGLGLVALDFLRVDEALALFDEALASGAGVDAEAKWNITCARLLAGDWEHAWEYYDLRWLAQVARRPFGYPEWAGGDLRGRTLLAYAEQGLGDEIMFASCYPELSGHVGHLVIDCAPKLERLFRRSFPTATVLGSSQASPPDWLRDPPHIDVQAAAGTIASRLRRSAASFPAHSGYLRADPERVAYWRARLDALGPGRKVGVSWRGGTRLTRTRLRSMPLSDWAPILGLRGAAFVSLQYHPDAGEEAAAVRRDHGLAVHHWPEALEDYDETAALVAALDVVVSVCTAIIHLGGALGRPVRVIVPSSPEWRYGLRGNRMPWYPSVRLYRQAAAGDWSGVLAQVAEDLCQEFGAQPVPRLGPS